MKQKPNAVQVSVIVPTYNERKNIEELVTRLVDVLKQSKKSFEIIFIDDRSYDGTYELLTKHSSETIKVFRKKGKRGKAFSLYEGFAFAQGERIVMIDADLQYPPEEIPYMLEKLETWDIVVANRKRYHDSGVRKFLSRSFRYVFGKGLFGLKVDIQSGLKAFKRRVIQVVATVPRSGWTFDLEFLHRAKEAGFSMQNHHIAFHKRKGSRSKINLAKTIYEIGSDALLVRTKRIYPMHAPSEEEGKMVGAGVHFRKKKYVTHTTLHHSASALRTFETKQKIIAILLVLGVFLGFAISPLAAGVALVAMLSTIYFIDVLFNLYIVLKSLHFSQEVDVSDKELQSLRDSNLPVYTILCPLYREAHVIPHFLKAIGELDWPKDKLNAILLLEEDDPDAKRVVASKLPEYVRAMIVPHSIPKTKPKACNYGLHFAQGEYLVIYDAEDIPDPLQLKKAYLAFKKVPKEVICLQAKLNYFNPRQNLLTRFFTAEYSLWFDVILTGLQSIETTIPLGGTSNHFRTKDLIRLEGWDPFNVTEDADLGIRLFRKGYRTAIIDSLTLEEANSNLKNWLRQRSRWIKGYMQTYLVHLRSISSFTKERGRHALFFHLVLGGKIAFIFLNPIMWITTISYFVLNSFVGATIEALFPSWVFYMAGFSLVFGNFLFMYYYMIGTFKRESYSTIKYVYLVPLYWILISLAGCIALFQLLFRPHYWEKTIHGLHLPKKAKVFARQSAQAVSDPAVFPIPPLSGIRHLSLSAVTLVVLSVGANTLTLFFYIWSSRILSLSNIAVIGMYSSFFNIASILFIAVSSTVAYRSGFLLGGYGREAARMFWKRVRGATWKFAIVLAVLWIAVTPLVADYFSMLAIFPLLSIVPMLIAGIVGSVDKGYLSGKLSFTFLGIVGIAEPLFKIAFLKALVTGNLTSYAYLAIPLSLVSSFLLGWFILAIQKQKTKAVAPKDAHHFPWKFFLASTLSGLSTMIFISFDVLLANRYLSPNEAGVYTITSLVGKMIFFLGGLSSQFILPLTSVNEGSRKSSQRLLTYFFITTVALSFCGLIAFGLMGMITLPYLFGQKAQAISPYALLMGIGMFYFTASRAFVAYYLTKKIYSFSVASFVLSVSLIFLIIHDHANIFSFVRAVFFSGFFTFLTLSLMHIFLNTIISRERMLKDMWDLFVKPDKVSSSGLRILILNWRDIKHVWAGGAEVYVHEIAKQFIKSGQSVTIFCGNDGKSVRNDVIDGVAIKRRGGTYLVYLWAVAYYLIRYIGKYDVVIDCENGIPFFTPLYVRKPVILQIHHIHQDVFRKYLPFPLSSIGLFLEAKLMPFIYRNKRVVTVSESSRQDIVKLGLAKTSNIHIVNPGIYQKDYTRGTKAPYPLFSYVGRLKPYKNVDVIIRAFAQVYASYPQARLSIMGEGETQGSLVALIHELGLKKAVTMYGKVSHEQKSEILSKSWAMLQPSMVEGWGITVIEANASGTPVIASNVPGLKDSILHGKTGVLVPPGDVDQFARAMVDFVLHEKYRLRLSDAAYIWSQQFSWEKSANEYFRVIYSEIKERVSFSMNGDIAVALK